MSQRAAVGRFLLSSVIPCGLAVLAVAAAGPTSPERVSVGDAGAEPDDGSYEGAVTGNGRFVAFQTNATNLAVGTTTSDTQIFLRDRKDAATLLASHDPDGAPGNDTSYYPALSNNGRFVVFESYSDNLVEGDGNFAYDVFLADMTTGDVTRVSEAAAGGDADASSYVYGASISKNGRFIVFESNAANLVEDDANGNYDVFLHDRVRGTTILVSRNMSGDPSNGSSQDPSISPNGRFIAYYSEATNLVDEDTQGDDNIYVYDVRTGTTTKASPGLDGLDAQNGCYDPVVSDNGRWVAFYSNADNLAAEDAGAPYDVFLYDRKMEAMRRVSAASDGTGGNGDSVGPAMSANGKVLVFYSYASNLVDDDLNGDSADVFRVDLMSGAVTLLSRNADGTAGDGDSYFYAPSLSSNGRYLAFTSAATNLVAGDTNGRYDEFLIRVK